jgi:hypothetical protein
MKEESDKAPPTAFDLAGNLSCHPDCGVRGYVAGSGYTPCMEMNMKQSNTLQQAIQHFSDEQVCIDTVAALR